MFSEENLDRFMQAEAALYELTMQYSPSSEQMPEFGEHCNWQRHFESIQQAAQLPDDYWREATSLLREQGLTPAEYVELMLKPQWSMMYEAKQDQMESNPLLDSIMDSLVVNTSR